MKIRDIQVKRESRKLTILNLRLTYIFNRRKDK